MSGFADSQSVRTVCHFQGQQANIQVFVPLSAIILRVDFPFQDIPIHFPCLDFFPHLVVEAKFVVDYVKLF